MNDVYVHDLSFSLGSVRRSLEETAAAGGTFSPAKALSQAGFRSHHVCADGESPLDLALRATAPLAARLAGTTAVIYATCIPLNGSVGDVRSFEASRDVKPLMDYPASRLITAHRLDSAQAIGLNQQACTSMLGALRIARGLLATEDDQRQILCVTADRFPAGARYEQAFNLISDGAAACLVSRAPRGFRLLATHHITNAAMVQATDEETAASYFGYTCRLVEATLSKVGMAAAGLKAIVPQNMHAKAWRILSRLLKVDPERVFFEPLPEVAHCISGDNIINLKALDDSGRLQRGDRVLCVMAGYGLNWQAALLEKQ